MIFSDFFNPKSSISNWKSYKKRRNRLELLVLESKCICAGGDLLPNMVSRRYLKLLRFVRDISTLSTDLKPVIH